MSINTENSLLYDKNALKKQPVVDRLSFFFGKILTSTLLIIIVMVSFLIGVSTHLAEVFDSWFLAIGMQAVILIASTNSDILPKVKIGSGTLTLIPFVMSLLMTWYLFISFKGLDFPSGSVEFWTALSKAVGLASTEYMFSYLFTFRFNKFMNDLNDLKKIEENEEPKNKALPVSEMMNDFGAGKPIDAGQEYYFQAHDPNDKRSPKITEFTEEPKTVDEVEEPKEFIPIKPKPTKPTNTGLL